MAGLFARMSQAFASSVGLAGSRSAEDAVVDDDHAATETLLFRCSGTLYRMLPSEEYAPVTEPAGAHLDLCSDDAAAPHVSIVMRVVDKSDGSVLLRQGLTDSGHMTFYHPWILWPAIVNNVVRRFGFRVVVDDAAVAAGMSAERVSQKFIALHGQCVYAVLTQTPAVLTEDIDDDVAFVTGAYSAMDSTEPSPGAAAADGDGAAQAEPEPQRPSGSVLRCQGATKNTWLNDVARHNRVVTSRAGGKLDFYTYSEAGIEEPGTLDIRGGKVAVSDPTDVVVTRGDTKLALLPTMDGAPCVTMVDIETGTAEEYLPGLDYQLRHLSLSAGKTDAGNPNLLVCSTNNACFSIDTRLDPSKCAVVDSGKSLTDYTHTSVRATQRFLCHATSAAGHLAIGDLTGQIRLFSGPPGSLKADGKGHHPKAAKTLLKPTAKEPIHYIDITADGKYVLATCENHLLVVCTEMPDSQELGFKVRMGAKKPTPLTLSVPPEVVAKVGKDFKLTRGVFGVGESGEHVITSSVGSHLLVWDLEQVKRAAANHRGTDCAHADQGVPIRFATAANGHAAFMDEGSVGVAPLPVPKRGKSYARF